MLRYRNRAGRTGHLQRGGRALGLRRVRGVPRTDGVLRRGALHGGGARGDPLFQPDDLLVELRGEAHLRPMREREAGATCNDEYDSTQQVTRGSSRT